MTQRSGHSFEARSSGASSHFVPLHHDPATRSRCRSEETPRPAKRPRRKAGARAKRGVSELCHVNTTDQLPNLEYKPAIQRSDCGFERRKTFAVEMNALARSSDIQRSFLSGAGGRTRTGTPSLAVDFESTTSTNSITPAYCGQPDPKHVFTREGTGNMHIIVHPGQIGKNFFCVPMEIFRNRRGNGGRLYGRAFQVRASYRN